MALVREAVEARADYRRQLRWNLHTRDAQSLYGAGSASPTGMDRGRDELSDPRPRSR